MFDDSLYKNTEGVLADFKLVIGGVDFKKSITMDVAYCLATNRANAYSYANLISKMFFPLQCNGFDEVIVKNDIVFSNWNDRKDYDELVLLIQNDIPGSCYVKIKEVFPRKLNFKSIFDLDLWRAALSCKIGFKAKLFILSRLLDYVNAYKSFVKQIKINKIDLSKKKYIPFNSSYGLENALTQFMNHQGCRTFHLCHGLHFSPNYRFFSVDAYNKKLIEAGTILSWSQSFVDNDVCKTRKHNIVGNPKYPYRNIDISFKTDSCVVFLARGQYDNNNIKLLEVLNQYSLKHNLAVTIKPHPTDNIVLFNKWCDSFGFELCLNKTIKELLDSNSYGFAISYESTAYFEAMYYNLVCFRYSYEENESYGDLDNRFLTAEDLDNQISKYSKLDKITLNKAIMKTLTYELGMGVNNYHEVIVNN